MCHEQPLAPIRGGADLVEERISYPGDGAEIPAHFVRPEGDATPGVVIISDIWGSKPVWEDTATRLAAEGFSVLVPDFFVRQGPLAERTRELAGARAAQMDQLSALNDLAAGMNWLRDRLGGQSIGIMGICMGGTLALLQSGREPLPDAVVSFYGFPGGSQRPRWTLFPIGEAEKSAAPILAIYGEDDAGVGMENVLAYRAAMEAREADYRDIVYPGVGHAFLTFDPDAPNHATAQDAWAAMLQFFANRLGAVG
jgi:carboxymethylenebutenolidase